MHTVKINNRKKSLKDWCAIFDANYSTAWRRFTEGETDPTKLFASNKHKPADIQAKIEKLYGKPKDINTVYKSEDKVDTPKTELLPMQYDVFTPPTRDAILLVDVLGEELLAELRRECRYHSGMPLTQAVHEAIKMWTADAQAKRMVARSVAKEEDKKAWSLW